ncbi:MAG: hypothetical protein AAGA03_01575 [Planctomycetota bacterium]
MHLLSMMSAQPIEKTPDAIRTIHHHSLPIAWKLDFLDCITLMHRVPQIISLPSIDRFSHSSGIRKTHQSPR